MSDERMMTFRFPNDAFQMRQHHRDLLHDNRMYILHNLCPGETFWSALLENGVFEADMLEEMKSQNTRTERVASLLNLLPHRGPEAFDAFLEALLKCGHGFVADFLKILEAADQFKTDIKPYNIPDQIQDRLIRTYKKSLPNVQRFFETKLEVNLQEQETEFHDKEHEITELEQQTQVLEEINGKMRTWFANCVKRTTTLGDEVKRSYVLQSALREETKNLEGLYEKASTDDKYEQLVSRFCDGMHSVIDYIKTAEDRRALLEHKLNCGDDEDDAGQNGKFGTNGKTITSKVQGVIDQITYVMEKTVGMRESPNKDLEQGMRGELEKSVSRLREIIKDLSYVKRIFLYTLRKKEDLSQETLSLVHNFREIRRLEKEMNEKQDHINELRTQRQTIKNKSNRHKRYLEKIQEEIAQKEKQLTELYDHLQKQVCSADQRVHFILSLLPDSGEEDAPKTLADDTKSEDGFSLLSRDLTYISIVRDRSDSKFSLRSEKNDVTAGKIPTSSTPVPTKPPSPNPPTVAVTDTRVAPIPKKPNEGNDNEPTSSSDKAISATNQTKTVPETNGVKVIKTPSVQDVDNLKSENSQQNLKLSTSQVKGSASQRDNGNSKLELPHLAFNARNKVQPVGVSQDKQLPTPQKSNSPPTSEKANSPPTPQKPNPSPKMPKPNTMLTTQNCHMTALSQNSKSIVPLEKKVDVKRKFTIGSVSSGLEMLKDGHKELTPEQQTNLIQVKPANDSNIINSRSACRDKDDKKTLFPPTHLQTKPILPSQQKKYSNPTDRYATKSMEPLSISSARASTVRNSDGKSPSTQEKVSHRSPVPTPRLSIKSNQHNTQPPHRFDPSVLMTDRPVPTVRTKRHNSTEDKDPKITNGVSTPRNVKPSEGKIATMPWSGMSSKQLLRPHKGEGEAVSENQNCTYPQTMKQSQAKSMDHAMLVLHADTSTMTANESVYSRVSNAINKVKEVKDAGPKSALKEKVESGPSPTEQSALTNTRLSLSTESSEGQAVDLWIQSSSSDECNQNQDGGSTESQNEAGGRSGSGSPTLRSSAFVSNPKVGDLELDDHRSCQQRTLSARTHTS